MTYPRLLTSVLALAAAVVPASASTVYCSTFCGGNNQTAFINATTSLFFPNAPITFSSGGLVPPDLDQYIDSPSNVNFFDFRNGSLDNVFGFTSVGTALRVIAGDLIKITLPANVLAFAVDFVQSSATATFCIEAQSTFDSNACQPDSFFPGTSAQFLGLVSTTPISNVWIGPITQAGSTQLNDFELGIGQIQPPPPATPEVATFLMIGSGLISLGVLRRKARPVA